MTGLARPSSMFDRDRDWAVLSRYAVDDAPGATLGVVSGRRRQGKTFLLRALCQATGGLYIGAEEATEAESLRMFGAAIAQHLGSPAPLALTNWSEVVDTLLALGRDHPLVIVIDEFPYLVRSSPSLPSVIQNALAPLRAEREQSRTRLLLCGSATSFMGRLLAADAPLRGRASLELVVRGFDYRQAAGFWGIGDPITALKVNAIVGGTPAYRREFTRDDAPADPSDFDPWVARTVLSPASPLFREARYLLAEEPDVRDPGLYHSVLASIASGHTNRGAIASYLGRKSGDLAHPLTVLQDCGLVSSEPDAFKKNRARFRINEPLITFYHAIMRPIWSDLEHTRDARDLWRNAEPRFLAQVLGPHFEHVCRYWLRHLAPPELLGARPSQVASAIVNDPRKRTSHELDLVAFGHDARGGVPVLALGEAKWGEVMGVQHLARLAHVRSLLAAQGRPGADQARLMCLAAAGFTDELRHRAHEDPAIVLVDAATLFPPDT